MKFSDFLVETTSKKELISKLRSALVIGHPGRSKITSHDIQEDNNSLSIRYWGEWEIPNDEEDDGDYDWEVLSPVSSKKLKDVVTTFEKINKCKVDVQVSEKNWIEFRIK